MSGSYAARLGWLLVLFATGCSPGSGSSVVFGSGLPRVPASADVARQEREMFLRLNRDREERGLPALRYDAKLADVARFHSADMRDKKFFAHESPTSGSLDDRLNAAGYLFLNARENLSEAPDVQTGQDALLRSPGHLANIVATDITHIGIGIVKGGVEAAENLSITQVFARPGRAESAAAAEASIVRQIQSARSGEGLGPAQRHELLDRLAKQHISELDAETTPSSLQKVGERVVTALSEHKDSRLRGVTVGAELLPDSSSLEVPAALLRPGSKRYGMAVRQLKNASGRPMLQLLFIVAQ